MAWIPSIQTNPDWFGEALLGPAAEFHALASDDPANHLSKLRNAVHLVVTGEEIWKFAPQRWLFARLAGASWSDRNASKWIEPLNRFDALCEASGLMRVSVGDTGYEALRRAYVETCRALGEPPSKGGRYNEADNRVFLVFPDEPVILPDELIEEEGYVEGAATPRLVNSFERSAKARRACLAHHGTRCLACGMSFFDSYGDIGIGFIHVHHKLPLEQISSEYRVDPIHDLVPLCPNCHAMIHRMNDPSDIEGLREIVLHQSTRRKGAIK